jgi:hypothetical protein
MTMGGAAGTARQETTVRRIQARGDLDEDESLALAYRELDAYRAERAKAM